MAVKAESTAGGASAFCPTRTPAWLRGLDPGTIAIIGASTNSKKRGYQAIRQLQEGGFPGRIYPVNPRGHDVLGLRCFPRLADIDVPIDMVFIAVPAASVPEVVRECGRCRVPLAVVIAGGFRESGDMGAALEREMVEAAHLSGVRVIGPNTHGFINNTARVNVVGAPDVPVGSLALVTQSGNIGVAAWVKAAAEGSTGFSLYVGLGNQADLTAGELIDALAPRDDVAAIAIHAESIVDGSEFLAALQRASAIVPVVVLKVGQTSSGQASAFSHTGAIAHDSAVSLALMRQFGAVTVTRSDEFYPIAEALSGQPAMFGDNVVVLTDGGGHGTLACDALTRNRLHLARLADETVSSLRTLLPPAASVRNPIDLAGASDTDPALFHRCLELSLRDPGVDAILIAGLVGGYGHRFGDPALHHVELRLTELMAASARSAHKPLIVHSAYAPVRPEAHRLLRLNGVPVYESLEVSVASLRALRDRGLRQRDASSTAPVRPFPARVGPTRVLTEPQARKRLAAANIRLPDWHHAKNAAEAVRAAAAIAGPVAMKIVSGQIVHKSDAGGVALNVPHRTVAETRESMLRRVASIRPDAKIEGVLITPMSPPGVEMIAGFYLDDNFGPVFMFGFGGINAELEPDAVFCRPPISRQAAESLLHDLRREQLLEGWRQLPAVDRTALAATIAELSAAVVSIPGLVELEINPIICAGDTAFIADVRGRVLASYSDAIERES
jgi:acetate---CoA ligase (ADP-forming)